MHHRLEVDFATTNFFPPPGYICRRLTFTFPEFEQCYYTASEDIFISGVLDSDEVFEKSKMRDVRDAWQLVARGRKINDTTFVDVGANIGLYSMYAAANGVGTIVAFEPLSTNIGLFSASVVRNTGFNRRIRLIAAGAGQRVEKLLMHVDVRNRGGSSFAASKLTLEGVEINRRQLSATESTLVPIDLFVRQHVDVMKIDVEGYESCVMAGARRLFADYGVTMIFLELWCNLTPCANSSSEVFADLQALGYEIYQSFSEFNKNLAQQLHSLSEVCAGPALYVELFAVQRSRLNKK